MAYFDRCKTSCELLEALKQLDNGDSPDEFAFVPDHMRGNTKINGYRRPDFKKVYQAAVRCILRLRESNRDLLAFQFDSEQRIESVMQWCIDNQTKQTSGKAGDKLKTTPETEGDLTGSKTINIGNFQGILGDVRAENVQTGQHAAINKHVEREQKKTGIVRKLLKWLVGIVAAVIVSIITALVTDFVGHFGWSERIYDWLWPK